MKAADEALYRAKAKGHGWVEPAPAPPPQATFGKALVPPPQVSPPQAPADGRRHAGPVLRQIEQGQRRRGQDREGNNDQDQQEKRQLPEHMNLLSREMFDSARLRTGKM